MPKRFVTGRYHSLYIDPSTISGGLKIIASDDDVIPQAVEHTEKRWYAVQFHPESLMTLRDRAGHRIIDAVMQRIS